MKLKKIFLCLIIAALALFSLAGCSDENTGDAALGQKLIGGWVPVNDEFYTADEEGNTLTFTVFEFTGKITKLHRVSADTVFSFFVNDYEIQDGKFKAIVDGQAAYAKIDFTEEGNLLWYTDTETTEFRPVTEEEIEEFDIPLNHTFDFELSEEEKEARSSMESEVRAEESAKNTEE